MEFIAHRINKIDELIKLSPEYGVELDLRDKNDRIIINHDPFGDGDDFEDYLKNYRHGTMILNVKSERIEYRILELLQKYNISRYFFLDSSFPMIFALAKSGEKNIALRFSEFEGLDTIVNMKGLVNWVWVDCFTKLPMTKEFYKVLVDCGYKLCLVSPELQKRDHDIETYKKYLSENGIVFNAICTKNYNIKKWM